MKKWMCICAAAVLAVSALTGCSTSAGAATTAAQTEAAKDDRCSQGGDGKKGDSQDSRGSGERPGYSLRGNCGSGRQTPCKD